MSSHIREQIFTCHFFTQMKIFLLTKYTHLNKTILTHTGKGREHGPRPRVPHASPGGRSPQVPSSASRKPLGAGKHATAGKGKRGWPGRRGPRKNGRVRHGRPKGCGRWRRERRTGGRQLRAARETRTLSDFTPPPGDRGREWNRKSSSSTSRKGHAMSLNPQSLGNGQEMQESESTRRARVAKAALSQRRAYEASRTHPSPKPLPPHWHVESRLQSEDAQPVTS